MNADKGGVMARKPKTADDVRRYLVLVQALASDDYLEHLSVLAREWDVKLTATVKASDGTHNRQACC